MSNNMQPGSFRDINSPQSIGRPSSDNIAEKAGQLMSLGTGRDTQITHAENIRGEEKEFTSAPTKILSYSSQEGFSQVSASFVNSVPTHLTTQGEYTTIILDNCNRFKIETDLLKHTSKYFASINRTPESWPESRYGTVKLNGVDLATLEVYKYWLQTGSIEETDTLVPGFALPLKADGTESQRQNSLRPVLVANKTKVHVTLIIADRLDQLVQCWIFADYIEAPAFQNDIMDALFDFYGQNYDDDCAFPLYNIPFICKNTASGSPLRGFITNAICRCLSGATLKKASIFKLIPKDLAIEVAVLSMDPGGKLYTIPWNRSYCSWHVHPSGELNAPCEDPFTWNGKSKEELRWDPVVDSDTGFDW